MRTPAVLLLTLLVAVVLAGCVGPTGADDECRAPPPQGTVGFLLFKQDGTVRNAPATTNVLWSLGISCAAKARDVRDLSFEIRTPDQGTLTARPTAALPNDGQLTMYAVLTSGSGGAEFGPNVPAPGTDTAYRFRIFDDPHSFHGLDVSDLLQLSYDAEGRRDFKSPLPVGTFSLTIRERATNEVLGLTSERFYDPGFSPADAV